MKVNKIQRDLATCKGTKGKEKIVKIDLRDEDDESATSTTHGLQFTHEKKKVKRKQSFKAGWQKSENSYTIPFYNG